VSLLSWRYRDPGALVAAAIGASPRQNGLAQPGGNSPQSLVNRTALSLPAGERAVAKAIEDRLAPLGVTS